MSRGDAIVILGCALQPSGQPSPALERRLRVGLEAWQRSEAPEIWVSGGRRWWGVAESSAMAAWLVQHHVPAERIYAEYCSFTTRENALYCRRAAEHRRGSRAELGRFGPGSSGFEGNTFGAGELNDPRSGGDGSGGGAPGDGVSRAEAFQARLGAANGVLQPRERIILVTCDFHALRARRLFAEQGFACSVRVAVTPRAPAAAQVARRLGECLRSGFVWLRGGDTC